MAQLELIDSRVSLKQCQLAVHALHAHQSRKEQELQDSELLPGKEQNIWLNVTVKKIPSRRKFKPVKIPIAHPLVDPRTTSVCLITKDPQREYKDLLDTHKIKFISRVVGIEKLKGKFKPFEARRMLLKENGLFLADDRIVPLLPKLLGVKWFEAKKQPIPVCLKRKDLKGELERAISSTYMNQNKGTCTSIKVGTLSQNPDHILANLKVALPAIAKNIQSGWDNIQAFHIKTNSSISLPIWSCTLDEKVGGRWDGLAVATDEEGESSDGDGGDEDAKMGNDATETRSEMTQNKGRKRTQDDDESEKPKKKVKGAQDKVMAASAAAISNSSAQTSAAASGSPSKPAKSASATDTPLKHKKRKSLSDPTISAPTDLTVLRPSVAEANTTNYLATKRSQKPSKLTTTDAHPRAREIHAKQTPGPAAKERGKEKSDTGFEEQSSVSAPKAVVSPALQASSTKQRVAKLIAETSTGKKSKKERTSIGHTAIPPKSEAASAQLLDDVSKSKSEKKNGAADVIAAKTTPTVSTPLTKDELKQKRGYGVVEKKNRGKTTGGKSAKNGVLGRKLAQ